MASKYSPSSFGLIADNYKTGTIIEGNNNMIFIVKENNAKKKWSRIYNIDLLSYEEPLIKESKFQNFFITNIKDNSFKSTIEKWHNIKNQFNK